MYAKIPRQAQAARFVFPGLYNITTRKRQISLVFSSEIFLGRFSTEIDDLGLILDDQAQPPKMTLRKRQISLAFSSEILDKR